MIPCVRWLSISGLLLIGCGKPHEQYQLPDQVTDFTTLYKDNCAGCHGQNGRYGAARPLNDGLYLTLIGKSRLRAVIAEGVPGTGMPGFAQGKGGDLTEQQVNVLADGMESKWNKPLNDPPSGLPEYSAKLGDANTGVAAFRQYCASCHGADGTGVVGRPGGSVVDPMYLSLVSDQSLRTMVVAGRSDEHIPNWRSYIAARSMTGKEIADVVAWVASHRPSSSDR